MSWWVPLAFAGAALAGLVIAFSLTSGRPRHDAAAAEPAPGHGAGRKSRFRQDNELVWNPAAFLTAAGLLGIVVLVAVLIEVL